MPEVKPCIILGTRPEIIKLAPVIRACQERRQEFVLLHTGQHYSYEMDAVFFEQLDLPLPGHNLDVGSGSHGAQTGKMLGGIERVLLEEKPTHVLVQGDTNTVLAGALAARKLNITVGHVEAGLRSFDRTMPEETNRVVADHVSDYLFAPTRQSAAFLKAEGIPDERVFITGNTIVDAVFQNRELAQRKARKLQDLGLEPRKYILMTAHRQENVDQVDRFQGMIDGARQVGVEMGTSVVYPIHPRSRKMAAQLGIDTSGVTLVDPLDFLSFLSLEANAGLILTDSGGVQEEACILGVPCVTLRDNTERPETVDVGANMLAGTGTSAILSAARTMAARRGGWTNPFGDGRASHRILDILGGSA